MYVVMAWFLRGAISRLNDTMFVRKEVKHYLVALGIGFLVGVSFTLCALPMISDDMATKIVFGVGAITTECLILYGVWIMTQQNVNNIARQAIVQTDSTDYSFKLQQILVHVEGYSLFLQFLLLFVLTSNVVRCECCFLSQGIRDRSSIVCLL